MHEKIFDVVKAHKNDVD